MDLGWFGKNQAIIRKIIAIDKIEVALFLLTIF